ncbi:MAG TPA: glucose-6-phosphate dehydrogenase assembly protein OpcA [Blastocatellia bacterium]|nr:glucose-6-phosphate dehydrogenase assembly protein OpcA [Blastocatellia bacterium]
MSTATIDIPAIERQLTSLWRQASTDVESGVIRSSTSNLLVYLSEDYDSSDFEEAMTHIAAERPCRALVMYVDHNGVDSTITADVTSRCTLPTGSSKQVCCEQVTINASGSQINEIPSAIAPLLIPDLPVYLWWRAEPRLRDRGIFGKLVEIADRVVIDSARFIDPMRDLVAEAELLRDNPRLTAISDLNWARLNAWRALIAGFYDLQEYRPFLSELSRVVIEHSRPEGTDAPISLRALLLGGWLASRLGWQIKHHESSGTGHSFTFESAGREVLLHFVTTERKIEPARLAKVTLESAADPSAVFSVRRSTDSTRIETMATAGGSTRRQRVLGYENIPESALLIRELDLLGHDRVYEQAVIAAAEMKF